jgi:hypothetical protein
MSTMCGLSFSLMSLFMMALVLGGTYAITTFGPKISKAMKTKIKTLTLLLHNQITS